MIDSLPDFLSMTPAKADRAWQRWVADRPPMGSDLDTLANDVRLAINEWRMNAGRDGEPRARENLATRAAKFWAAYKAND